MTHSCLADKEALGNLFVSQPFADQCDDLAFSRGERDDLRLLGVRLLASLFTCHRTEYVRYHRAFEPHLAYMYFLDGLEKNIYAFLLQHQTHCPQADRLTVQFGVVYPRQDKDSRCTGCFKQVGQEVEAAGVAEVKIEEDNIRLFTGSQGKRLGLVRCLADDAEVRPTVEKHAQCCTHHHLVLNDQNSDR